MSDSSHRKTIFWALAGVCCLAVMGCGGGGGSGISVSGKVTFKNQPVAIGKIYFTPGKGNAGAQGVAEIVNGEYTTEKTGRGAPAGINIVRVVGFENAQTMKMIFQFEEQMDISSALTKNFDIPAEAAGNVPPQASGPPP